MLFRDSAEENRGFSLRSKVDIGQGGYQALLSHLRDRPAASLADWKGQSPAEVEPLIETEGEEDPDSCASILGEVPNVSSTEVRHDSPGSYLSPKKWRRHWVWKLMACTVAVVATVLFTPHH